VLAADLDQNTIATIYPAQKDVNFSAVCPAVSAQPTASTKGCSCEVPASEDRPLRGAVWGLSIVGLAALVRRVVRKNVSR
jgi:MYXO-CTERM domain-containing protein